MQSEIDTKSSDVGVVLIGRNEGERLRVAFKSLAGHARHLLYVDSGSSDGSVALARSVGAAVVELDLASPFTAARARNEGFSALKRLHPELKWVFFVDGDCEVAPGWLASAKEFLEQHPQVALAWGIRRERFPDASVYNALCNIEWQDSPPGATRYCGGDSFVRVSAFQQVEGYRADLICGEEPEMCVRLRRAGWLIWHLKEPMTVHDAAIYRFGQWWKRMVRGGYAFANGASLHGGKPERLYVRESLRIWLWALGLPLACLLAVATFGPWGLTVLAAYPAKILRMALLSQLPSPLNWWRALTLEVGKFAELAGQIKFLLDRLQHQRSAIIEYK